MACYQRFARAVSSSVIQFPDLRIPAVWRCAWKQQLPAQCRDASSRSAEATLERVPDAAMPRLSAPKEGTPAGTRSFEKRSWECYKSDLRHALNFAYIRAKVCREGVPGAWLSCFPFLDKEPRLARKRQASPMRVSRQGGRNAVPVNDSLRCRLLILRELGPQQPHALSNRPGFERSP